MVTSLGGLQVGGGINSHNALNYIEEGASHVIVTSVCFSSTFHLLCTNIYWKHACLENVNKKIKIQSCIIVFISTIMLTKKKNFFMLMKNRELVVIFLKKLQQKI